MRKGWEGGRERGEGGSERGIEQQRERGCLKFLHKKVVNIHLLQGVLHSLMVVVTMETVTMARSSMVPSLDQCNTHTHTVLQLDSPLPSHPSTVLVLMVQQSVYTAARTQRIREMGGVRVCSTSSEKTYSRLRGHKSKTTSLGYAQTQTHKHTHTPAHTYMYTYTQLQCRKTCLCVCVCVCVCWSVSL